MKAMSTLVLVSALVLACAVMTALAQNDSVSGNWKVTGDISGYPVNQVCTFTQDGKKLTGSCKSAGESKTNEISGDVDDKKVTWQFDTEYNGSQLTITFKGTLDTDSQLKGDIDVQPLGASGTFTARREEGRKEEPKKAQ